MVTKLMNLTNFDYLAKLNNGNIVIIKANEITCAPKGFYFTHQKTILDKNFKKINLNKIRP